jgi:V-type H+-transporting ATPase subunit H
MQSSSLLSEGTRSSNLRAQEKHSHDKAEMSKNLFAQINWEEILKAGVFLSHRDVMFLLIILLTTNYESFLIHVYMNT